MASNIVVHGTTDNTDPAALKPILKVNTDGSLAAPTGSSATQVQGRAADGAAVAGNPVLIGGQDGTNAQSILTDTTGRQVVVGAAADGAAVAGNPVLMAGQDGTNAQSLLTDSTGRQVMVGAAADGAAVAGNPVLMAGQDGTNAQSVLTDSTGRLVMVGGAATTVTTSITRPANTTAYAANDCWSDSDSAPVSGGFTLTDAARLSGGSGVITDMVIVSSNDPATLLQGEIWIYDSSVTNDNDNAAFTSSDADTLKLVGVAPFTLASTVAGTGTTSYAAVTGLNIGFTAVGTANLRFKVKVKNAYTPASEEVLTVRAKIVQTN